MVDISTQLRDMVLFYNLAFSHLIDTGCVFPSLSLCHSNKVLENIYMFFWVERQIQLSGTGNLAFKLKKAVETEHFIGWRSQLLPLQGTRGISTEHLRNFTDLVAGQYKQRLPFTSPCGQAEIFHQHDFSCLHAFSNPETSLGGSYTTVIDPSLLMLPSWYFLRTVPRNIKQFVNLLALNNSSWELVAFQVGLVARLL